jgi:hypothetical protein
MAQTPEQIAAKKARYYREVYKLTRKKNKTETTYEIEFPLTPDQWFGDNCVWGKEEFLWAEVMREAVDCLKGRVAGYMNDRREYREEEIKKAREWFGDMSKEVGGFVWCCKVVGVIPEEMVMKLKGRGWL